MPRKRLSRRPTVRRWSRRSSLVKRGSVTRRSFASMNFAESPVSRESFCDGLPLGGREPGALHERERVVARGELLRLLDRLLKVPLEIGRELLVVPGRGRVGREES